MASTITLNGLLDINITTSGIHQGSNCIPSGSGTTTTPVITQCTTIDCTTINCTTINCTTIQCTTINCTTIQCNTVQCNTVKCSDCVSGNCNCGNLYSVCHGDCKD